MYKIVTMLVIIGYKLCRLVFLSLFIGSILPYRIEDKHTLQMTYTFIVNTENVNEYGYRILTAGIDFKQYLKNPVVLFMHDRYDKEQRGSEVIGKCVKLWVKDTQLLCEVEFDESDDFAKKIAGKVERGFIRMASMFANIIACSNAPEDLLPGQVYETVTKCKLVEISIVDIGGNDDALRLSKSGDTLNLKKLSINQNENMSNLRVIALAYGLPADADEAAILAKHNELKNAKETSESEVIKLKGQLKDIRTAEATTMVAEAVQLGLIAEALTATHIAAFETDFDGQKAILSKLITDAKAAGTQTAAGSAVKEIVLGGKGNPNPGAAEETFDYLQKHNVAKLQKMQAEDPTAYAKLFQDYQNGVRYTVKA